MKQQRTHILLALALLACAAGLGASMTANFNNQTRIKKLEKQVQAALKTAQKAMRAAHISTDKSSQALQKASQGQDQINWLKQQMRQGGLSQLAARVSKIEARLSPNTSIRNSSQIGYLTRRISSLEQRMTQLQRAQSSGGRKRRRMLDLVLVRQQVLNVDPRISRAANRMELAVLLRDYVHHSVPLKKEPYRINYLDFYTSYERLCRDDAYPAICGGISIAYMIVCEAFGLPSRYVGLFSSDHEPYNSHATVEVFLDGHWLASDPTYNVMLMANGDYLSYSQWRQRMVEGKPFKFTTNGMNVDAARRMKGEVRRIYESCHRFMIAYPARVHLLGQKQKSFPMIILPKTWDGRLILKKDKIYDMKRYPRFYSIISNGVMR